MARGYTPKSIDAMAYAPALRPYDLIYEGINGEYWSQVTVLTNCIRMAVFGRLDHAEATMQAALSSDVPWIGYNREGTNDDQLLLGELITVYNLAESYGLKLMFGPTGGMLDHAGEIFVPYCHSLVYQTQSGQGTPGYASEVKVLVDRLQAERARLGLALLPLWLQVSVNPPSGNRTAEQVESDIVSARRLGVKSAGWFVFYDPDRWTEAVKVLNWLRK